jgi:hypothetical protein
LDWERNSDTRSGLEGENPNRKHNITSKEQARPPGQNWTLNTTMLLVSILGFTQSLTEMSTRSRKIMFLWSRVLPVRRADNLAAI